MKNFFLTCRILGAAGSKLLVFFAFICLAQTIQAQPSGGIWTGSSSNKVNASEQEKVIRKLYLNLGNKNLDLVMEAYAETGASVDPAGNTVFNKKDLREGLDAFFKELDEAPRYSYENLKVRMLTSEWALSVWDSNADIHIGGQQIAGKSKCLAVLHNIKGEWKIEFDQTTPTFGMPALDNQDISYPTAVRYIRM